MLSIILSQSHTSWVVVLLDQGLVSNDVSLPSKYINHIAQFVIVYGSVCFDGLVVVVVVMDSYTPASNSNLGVAAFSMPSHHWSFGLVIVIGKD